MKLFSLAGIFMALISCQSSESDKISTKNHEWLRSRSQDVIEASQLRTEYSDTKNEDIKIIKQMKYYQSVTDELLETLSLNSREDILSRMNLHLDTLIPPNVVIYNPYKDFLSLDKNSSLNEYRTSIALLEVQTFDVYVSQMGTYDMIFDSRDIYFIADFNQPDDGNLTGKLMLAATNSELEKYVIMYLNEQVIEVKGGYGIVNIPVNELSTDKTFSVKIVGKQNDLEIVKEIEIGNP